MKEEQKNFKNWINKIKDAKDKENIPSCTLNIETSYTSFSVHYKVSGPRQDVEAWCRNLCDQFHPAGYGTHYKINNLDDGTVVAEAYRGTSCD